MRRTNRRGTAPSTSPAEKEEDVYSEIFYFLSNEGEEEEEDEQSNINITLEDLQKCALDSESQAAKKFGCGTTRFKTM